jgi:DME family drug/metabolite transporter
MIGIFLVVLAAFLWGTVGVASSLVGADARLDPAIAGLVRTGLGASSLLLAAAAARVPAADGLPLALLALFGLAGAVFQTCLFAAFTLVGVTVTVAVTVCVPVVLVALWDAAVERQAPPRRVCLAYAIATAGVLLAMFGGAAEGRPRPVIGVSGALLLAAASIAFAVVVTSARTMARTLHPIRVAGLGLACTAAALMLVVLVRTPAVAAIGELSRSDVALLAYTGIVATGGAYLAFVLGMRLCQSSMAGLTATLVEPGVAALLAALLLRERLATAEALGCGLMIGAILLLVLVEARASGSPARTP